jgi:anti-anti-sigma factor
MITGRPARRITAFPAELVRRTVVAPQVPPERHRMFSAHADTITDRVDARGDLDSFTVEHLRGVMEILFCQGHNCITLDCKGLLTIDPPGIDLLVAMQRKLNRTGGYLRIVNAQPGVLTALKQRQPATR